MEKRLKARQAYVVLWRSSILIPGEKNSQGLGLKLLPHGRIPCVVDPHPHPYFALPVFCIIYEATSLTSSAVGLYIGTEKKILVG